MENKVKKAWIAFLINFGYVGYALFVALVGSLIIIEIINFLSINRYMEAQNLADIIFYISGAAIFIAIAVGLVSTLKRPDE